MDIIKSLSAVYLVFSLCSCSIKEDRGPCPCHLNVNIKECSAYTDRIMLSAWRDGNANLFTDKIKLKDYPEVYTRKVEKGPLYVCAFSGYGDMVIKNNTLIIPEGEECPEVMAFRGDMLDASGESADETVILHKQFAKVFFITDDLTESIGDIIFRAVGTANGFDISAMKPCKGSFNAIAVRDMDGIRSLRVPRQVDDDLKLEIYVDGVLYGNVDIGEEIRLSGYSWEDKDLCDIYLTVSLFSSYDISVNVKKWDTESVQYTI
ncbi:MAG: hypothetical protein Q4G10_00360 [Bacteroidia bacterium]|nr:hypothetical protein [Bacteroidia bacterium]